MRNADFPGGRELMLPVYQIDAFTIKPFRGNPAAVCIVEKELSDETYQSIAAEMNHSETAFVRPIENVPLKNVREYSLRWFTPVVEVPLCGHATLASAKVLFDEIGITPGEILFHTKSGILRAVKEHDTLQLDFPMCKPFASSYPSGIETILGVSRIDDAMFNQHTGYLMLRIPSKEEIFHMMPDFTSLRATVFPVEIKGLIVTAAGDNGGYDFYSRFFAPWLGVNEDPVTGSSHTMLYPYWSKILHKDIMIAYQASARGGELYLRGIGSRVIIGGKAVIVTRGILYIS